MTTDPAVDQREQWSAGDRAAVVYDAAADHFDAAPLDFWNRHGRTAVALLNLRPGMSVLDVGCGAGASAIPAAVTVGRTGEVVGVDMAGRLLALGWQKAEAAGLDNVRFEIADMADTGFASARFDAIVSVFSVFFVARMETLVAELWRMLRPGGQLLITTWGPDAFQPAASVFGETLSRLTGRSASAPNPWERVCEPDQLQRLFEEAIGAAPSIEFVRDRQPLHAPEEWWTIVLGSGFRAAIDGLSRAQTEQLRAALDERLFAESIDSIDTSALHAVAHKPLGP